MQYILAKKKQITYIVHKKVMLQKQAVGKLKPFRLELDLINLRPYGRQHAVSKQKPKKFRIK